MTHPLAPVLEAIIRGSHTYGIALVELAQNCLEGTTETDKLISKLKDRILTLKQSDTKGQKDNLKELQATFCKLVDMEAEERRLFLSAEEQFSSGVFEGSVKMLEDSILRFSRNPIHKARYYGELCRHYLMMGQLSKGADFLKKEEKWSCMIQSSNGQSKRILSQLYSNQIGLAIRRVWHIDNSPYTSRKLDDDDSALSIANKWRQLFADGSTKEEKVEFCRATKMLGVIYSTQNNHNQAVRVYLEAIKACPADGENVLMELHGSLGDCYQHLKAYDEAIKWYEGGKALAHSLNIQHAFATYLVNIAFCRYRLLLIKRLKPDIADIVHQLNAKRGYQTDNRSKKQVSLEGEQREIEIQFNAAIDIFNKLESNLADIEHRVPYFNVHDVIHISFENYLFTEGKVRKALEVAQSRRARSLKAYITKKHPTTLTPDKIFTAEEMQKLAGKLNTTFILYSLAPCQFKNPGPALRMWVITPTACDHREVPIPHLIGEIQTFSSVMNSIVGELRTNVRRCIGTNNFTVDELLDNSSKLDELTLCMTDTDQVARLRESVDALKEAINKVNQMLASWYPILIPIELTKDIKTSLTIIPEGELAKIPFAALRDNTQYLIQKFPLSTAPSIHILSVLAELNPKGEPPSKEELLAVYSETHPELPFALEEIGSVTESLGSKFEVKCLKGEEATKGAFLKEIRTCKYNYIHIVCHGNDEEAKQADTIFKGALKFSSKHAPYDYVYGNDLAELTFDSKLVFLSACSSGKGKIHQEGNVGLAWALLAANVKATVSCQWLLYDTALTVDMISNFYQSLAEGNSPAIALQHSMNICLTKNPNRPDKWGLFSITGLG